MNLLWEVNSYSRVALSSDLERLPVGLGTLASPKEPLELYSSIAPLIISPRTPVGAGTRVQSDRVRRTFTLSSVQHLLASISVDVPKPEHSYYLTSNIIGRTWLDNIQQVKGYGIEINESVVFSGEAMYTVTR